MSTCPKCHYLLFPGNFHQCPTAEDLFLVDDLEEHAEAGRVDDWPHVSIGPDDPLDHLEEDARQVG